MTKKLASIEKFDLEKFCQQLDVPQSEQQAVRVCLEIGLERYHRQRYGHHNDGKRSGVLVEEWLTEPYLFGFGAVEAVRREALSPETRMRIVRHAVEAIDVTAEFGIPHGLPIMASFLARAGKLDPAIFRSMMLTADFSERMFDDWQFEEVCRVCDWLIAEAQLPAAERLWWLWLIGVSCEDPAMIKSLSESLLAHPRLAVEHKQALCEAWLADTLAGEPPAQWEALQALLRGDMDTFAARATAAGLPLDENLPSSEQIEADYDSALDALIDAEDEGGEAPVSSLHVLRKTLVGSLGEVVLTPSGLKYAALRALPAFGADPLEVCKRYLRPEQGGHADVVNQAVAEVLRSHAAQLSGAAARREVRALVDQGLKVGGVSARKAFYQLGADLFGKSYWNKAARDSARSIRDWAAKKSPPAAKKPRPRKAAKK